MNLFQKKNKEMEKIIASKKNLMERWQRSLANMQRRDKAV